MHVFYATRAKQPGAILFYYHVTVPCDRRHGTPPTARSRCERAFGRLGIGRKHPSLQRVSTHVSTVCAPAVCVRARSLAESVVLVQLVEMGSLGIQRLRWVYRTSGFCDLRPMYGRCTADVRSDFVQIPYRYSKIYAR